MIDQTTAPDLAALAADIRLLRDKQDLYDIVARFCRGADRCDRELMLSCFWEDAIDDHGPSGEFIPASQMIENAMSKKDVLSATPSQHVMANALFEIDGDQAHGEIYTAIRWGGADANYSGAFGRYLDRYERRNGEWRIIQRITNIEWAGQIPWPNPIPGTRDRTDLSYGPGYFA